MINVNSIFEKIKGNLALIILLPAIFGGLWQIIELARISISYIRFFSATQLLPDGLLMLFILTSLYFAYRFGTLRKSKLNVQRKIIVVHESKPLDMKHYFIKMNQSNKLVYVENPIYKHNFIVHIVFILFGASFLWFIFSYYILELNSAYPLMSLGIAIIMIMLYGRMIIESLIVLLVKIFESKIFQYLFKKPIIQELIMMPIKVLSVLLFFLFIIILPLKLFSLLHQNYFLPENLKNLENIETSLKAKDYNKSEILYFNDKYIFIEHSNGDKNTTIEILLFNALFDVAKEK
ncbi:hypothetical protein KJ870_11110 [bacterium]|nr:hypothetical protein [bacterium]MBU1435479.1 hypothetical protein [bacterium]MBU1502597.1 hypothetical protein [bacterium]